MMKNSIKERIDSISKLEKNWDGYGAVPISLNTIDLVYLFLDKLSNFYLESLDHEDIVPSAHGTVSLEWSIMSDFAQIEIGENGSGYYSEIDGEEPYNDDLIEIDEFINVLKKLYGRD